MKHLLLDVNIILDMWLERGEYLLIDQLLEEKTQEEVQVWCAAGSLPIIEYIFVQTVKNEGATALEATALAKKIFALLFSRVQILSNFGFEQSYAIENAHTLEDAQITLAMHGLHGKKRIVTNDSRFDTLGLIETCSVDEALAWIRERPLPDNAEETIPFIDLYAQQDGIRPQLEENIQTVLRHGKYILGPEVQELEQRLAEFVGVRHCIGVSSGTDALLMGLMAAGIGPGDAVFTTPFTFIATAEVISLLGAIPVFVDIDPRTFNIAPEKLKLAIQAVEANNPAIYPLPGLSTDGTLKPRAIIPVDLFGLPADYDPILEIAKKHNLFVLEDAAQGLGGIYRGRGAGGLGHMGTTSFFPAKPLGCYGDGGAIFTNDDELTDIARSIRIHGKGTDKYDNIRIGLNARLHTMQAAILLAKLDKFPEELKTKQRVTEQYTDLLAANSAITTPFVPDGLQSAWAQYSVLTENRDAVMAGLKVKNIPAAVYYAKPLHLQPAYRHLGYQRGDMPIAEQIAQQIFSLPMHGYLTADEIKHIVTGVTMSL